MLDLRGPGRVAAIAATAVVAAAGAAQAETIEDYARMNCVQFVELPLERQLGVLFWIDGYLSRTDGDQQLDFLNAAYAIRDFEDECAREPRVTLGQFLGVRF